MLINTPFCPIRRLHSLLVTTGIGEATSTENHQGHGHDQATTIATCGQTSTTCDTTSKPCALRVLTSLVELNLSANCFESSTHSLAVITRAEFARLISLDFRDNHLPLDQETNELQRISKVRGISKKELYSVPTT